MQLMMQLTLSYLAKFDCLTLFSGGQIYHQTRDVDQCWVIVGPVS